MNSDALFRNYYRPLCIYALHYLLDVEQVEDVVQDCFVRLLEIGDEPQNARGWLYTAVRNRCIDQLRRKNPLLTNIQPEDLDGLISDDEAQERAHEPGDGGDMIPRREPLLRKRGDEQRMLRYSSR